ncbi:MAG: T9SS type A sorting domain-containing protein [Flavobacteriales bacterium]|nr:T9SS type A sorting domain-containing protein [Flavobacteriales bacterium]
MTAPAWTKGNGLLRVFDMQGRVITSTTVKGNGTFQFATSDHAAGAYRVSIEMSNAPALSSSFVVVH